MGAGASALQGLPDQVPKKQAQALAAATPGLHWDDAIWSEIEHSDGTADKVDIIGLLDQLNLRVNTMYQFELCTLIIQDLVH